MTLWQKRARLIVAFTGIAVIVAVLATVRGRGPATEAETVLRVDPEAVAESAGGRMVLAKGTEIPGTVDFDRMLSYGDGTAKLLQPVYTTERSGREFVVTSREATVGADQSHIVMRGDVELIESDGWTAETDEATFSRGEGVVRAPGPFAFRKGNIRGSSVGMRYDQPRDVLWLLDQAVVIVTPDRQGPGAEITAGSAGYARRDKYLRFEGGVKLVREGRVIQSESAMAFLSADESRLERIELRGGAHILTPEAAQGGLRDMYARDMNLVYGGDGEALERATLAGGAFSQPTAAIQFAGAGDAPGRRLSGEHIDIVFGGAGEIASLAARDRVELSLPAESSGPARVIRSSAMDGRGQPGTGLTAATFSGGVEFSEALTGAVERRARARTLTVAMHPDSGAIQDARFAGGTRFEDGAVRASAREGRYRIDKGVLDLTGSDNAADPRVEDERITVQAARIELTFEGPKLVATGAVRSELRPAPKASEDAGPGTGRTVPGMLKGDQPVYVTGAEMEYDGSRGYAEYGGGSRLWQGDTTIQGETIVLDESSGDLKASGGADEGLVRSTFALQQTDEKTGEPVTVPSIASSRTFHYEDALRRATYTTDAHVNGPQGDCHGVKIEMYFTEAGGSLERAEAYERVRLTADARSATGDRMTYFAADERYVMLGTPVTIIEECRETTGKTLTFWRSTDRILVDGNEEIRTLTKSGGPCAQTRFD